MALLNAQGKVIYLSDKPRQANASMAHIEAAKKPKFIFVQPKSKEKNLLDAQERLDKMLKVVKQLL